MAISKDMYEIEKNMLDCNLNIEGLSGQETKKIISIIEDFVKSYINREKDMSNLKWLVKKLQEEMPNVEQKVILECAEQTCKSVQEFDDNTVEMDVACSNGMDRETWFVNKVKDAATGVGVNEFGNYLNEISHTLNNVNAQMMRTVGTQTGNISRCMNLDSFIAEQYSMNNFNMQVKLERSQFSAEICVPEEGKTSGLNSFDVVIKNTITGKNINQYYFKFGKDAKATIALLKGENCNDQCFVVPAEQVDEVRKTFPNKSVQFYIGGTENCPVKSKPFTQEDIKRMQIKVEETGVLPRYDWNNYNTKDLVLNIGKKAGLAGVQGALVTTGYDLVAKIVQGKSVGGDENIEVSLKTGADAGIKIATAGALKVCVEKGYLGSISKRTPTGVFANIACVGIENAKILAKVATGELAIAQGLDNMGRTSIVLIYGLGRGTAGVSVGSAALSWVPIVGPIVGGIVGGTVGYMAGYAVGKAICEGGKMVEKIAKKVAKATWSGGNK